MSNIVKVQSNLVRDANGEKVRLPIRMTEIGDEVWEELRFSEDEKNGWVSIGIIYPYIAYRLRLARMSPQDFRDNPKFGSAFKWVFGLDRGLELCIELFNEQQQKKIDPFYGLGHLG